MTVPAQAQPSLSGAHGNVIVDSTVLDNLGPAPTLPGMLRPRIFGEPRGQLLYPNASEYGDRIVLQPPQGRLAARDGTRTDFDGGSQFLVPPRAAATGMSEPTPFVLNPPVSVQRSTVRPVAEGPPRLIAPAGTAPRPSAKPDIDPPPPPQPARDDMPAESQPADREMAAETQGRPAEMTPQPAATETRTAMISPPPSAPDSGAASLPDRLTIGFNAEESNLSAATEEQLAVLAEGLKAAPENRYVILNSYASGGEEGARMARRVSLTRGLAVRKFLIEEGVSSTRIEVKALGNNVDGGPPDRVDAILSSR